MKPTQRPTALALLNHRAGACGGLLLLKPLVESVVMYNAVIVRF